MKEHFIRELLRLQNLIAEQGGRVEQAITQALEAFNTGDAALAERVIAADSVIDAAEIRIEEECLKTLALYQPVASDLRTVAAILKINTALERMADFGSHIAERAQEISRFRDDAAPERLDFSTMSELVLSMLRDALTVLRTSDTVLAYRVIDRDDAVDNIRHNNKMFAVQAITRFPSAAEYYIACIGLSRDLERIADFAADICEHIIYLHSGKIIRHSL